MTGPDCGLVSFLNHYVQKHKYTHHVELNEEKTLIPDGGSHPEIEHPNESWYHEVLWLQVFAEWKCHVVYNVQEAQ